MRVSRFTNAYGANFLPTGKPTAFIEYVDRGTTLPLSSGPAPYKGAVRQRPSNGLILNGFRYPTNWSALAYEATYNSYDYVAIDRSTALTSQKRRYYGSAANGQHFVARPNYYSVLGDKVVVTVDTNLVNRARTECLNKIKQQNIDLGAALAESEKTLAELLKVLRILCNALRAAKRGDIRSAGRLLGYKDWKSVGSATSEWWLSYQYGFKPLMDDLYGLQEQLKDGFANKDQLFKVSRQVEDGLPLYTFLNPGSWLNQPVELGGSARQIVKVCYWQKVSFPWLYMLNQMGLINPAAIAWELVPWSFVIDWLIPIGNFLQALTDTFGVSFVAGYEDRIVEADIHWSHYLYEFLSGNKCSSSYKQFAFQRIAKSSWDIPIPYWKNPFSTTHVANALALLHSLKR